uniref:TGF-beta family profile domain-containing protein n=1 Tax=Ciona savignyi TaxID=51511 RepID=H2Z9U2_CIOSA
MRLASTMRILLLLGVFWTLLVLVSARRNRQRNGGDRRGGIDLRPRRNRGGTTGTANRTLTRLDPGQGFNSEVGISTPLSETTEAGRPRKRKNKRQKKRKGRKGRKGHKSRKGTKRTSEIDTILEEPQRELLRNTMIEMFGFDHMVSPRLGRVPPSVPTFTGPRITEIEEEQGLPHPPDFMLQLYETFSAERNVLPLQTRSQGNTVRSFFSVAGDETSQSRNKGRPILILPTSSSTPESNSRPMRAFAFNVTSIPEFETVVKSELRLDITPDMNGVFNASRGVPQVIMGSYRQITIRNEMNETIHFFERNGNLVRLRQTSATAWSGENISEIVKRSRPERHLIVVRFEHAESGMRQKRDADSVPDNHSFRQPARDIPDNFMIMGSDRSKRNTGRDHPGAQPNRAGNNHDSMAPLLVVYSNDTKAVVSKPGSTTPEDALLSRLGNLTASLQAHAPRRVRRSSKTRRSGTSSHNGSNSLPGEERVENVPRTRIPISRLPNPADNDQTELHDNGIADKAVLQSLTDQKSAKKLQKAKRRRRRPCRKRGRRGRRKCKKTVGPPPDLNRSQHTCSRKPLTVNFADIGWSEWIITPTHLDAYYCSGLCGFNTQQNAQFSNHAIIQSVIKAYNINSNLPSPCCVPDEMMGLSVLFYDRHENVVLKNYPDMSVNTCACR